jgi:hypothetical protein
VVECKDGDGEVRGCGKDLIDDGLGLCGAHGEGEVSEGWGAMQPKYRRTW